MTLRMSARALRDLAGIYNYIAAENVEAAGRVTDHLLQMLAMLEEQPRLGHEANFRHHRELVVGNYIVGYTLRRDEIVVRTIRHGAQRKRGD